MRWARCPTCKALRPSALLRDAAADDDDEEDGHLEAWREEQEDSLRRTTYEAPEAALRVEARLDVADARAAAEYKAKVWRQLRCVERGRPFAGTKGALGAEMEGVTGYGCARGAGWRQGEERGYAVIEA